MTKFVRSVGLLLGLVMTSTILSAQITYTSASFQQAGDIVTYNTNNDTTLLVTAASNTATSWDFSTWTNNNRTTDTVQAASSGAQFSSFPSTDILQPLLAGFPGTTYVDVSSTQMTRIGGGIEILGFSFFAPYADQHITQVAPFSYPNLASDDYELFIGEHIDSVPFLRATLDSIVGGQTSRADSIRINLDGKEVREVDAFGTCMFSDTTIDVLRQKVINIVTIKIEIKVDPGFLPPFWLDVTNTIGNSSPVPIPNNDSLVYYDYLSEGAKQPVARFQMNPNNSNEVAAVQYREIDTTTINVTYIEDQIAVNIFPNPANKILYIQSTELPQEGYNIELVDIMGRITLSNATAQGEHYQQDISRLTNGQYALLIRNKKGELLKREKITISR
jgi:hypothetical protein